MLTGKKIGALFFGILVMSLAITFFPLKTEALTSADFKNPKNDIGPISETAVSVERLKEIYAKNTAQNTFDFGSDGYYAITDGKGTFAIFEKGVPDSKTSTVRDSSKDTLVGTVATDGKYRELKKPILKSNAPAQMDAVNSASKQGGNDSDVWTAVMSKDNSTAAVDIQIDQAGEDRRKLQAAKDLRAQYIATKEDTTKIDEEIKVLTAKAEASSALAKAKNKTNQEAYNKNNTPAQGDAEAIYCMSDGGVGWGGVKLPIINFSGCFAMVGNIVLKGAAWILWASAIIFDKTLDYTLGSGFKDIVEKSTFITVGWGMFRDISNLFFIFILLFISIGTILNNSKLGSKSLIPSILMAAVLINFSLFFTKVIIDASNIVTLQFYAQMNGDDISKAPTSGDATGIAAQFIRGLNLTTLYTIGSGQSASSGNDSAASQASKVSWLNSNAWNIILVSFGGTILILITAFMFFAATILFFYRAIIFVFLMTTAPIAFMSKAIPSGHLNSLSGKWWSKLWSQALFAPAYMALTYLVILLMKSGPKGGNFAALFAGNTSVGVSTAISFIMIIGFMVMSLTAATSFGGYASSGVMSMGRKIAGWGKDTARGAAVGSARWVGRETVGNVAYRAANSNWMRTAASSGLGKALGGGMALRAADKVSKAKFGGKTGYPDVIKQKKERDEATVKIIENQKTVQGLFEGGKAYKARAEETARKNKEKANKYLNIRKNKDTGNLETYSWLGLSKAQRFATNELQQARIKKQKSKSKKDLAKDNLKAWLGEKPEAEGGGHHDDIENPLPGFKLAQLKEQIKNLREKSKKTPAGSDERKLHEEELKALIRKETRVKDKLERDLETTQVTEDNPLGEIKDALKENSKKDNK